MIDILNNILNLFRKKPSYLTIKPDMFMEPKPAFAQNYRYQKHFIVFDFETTGTDPLNCEIVEIGAIKVDGDEIIDTFQSFIKPFNPIPAEAAKVNNITNEMVKDAPSAENVIPSFIDFIGDSKLIGYNIMNFDHIILRRYAKAICNKTLPNTVTDVYQLCRKSIKIPKYTLSDVARYFDVSISNAHRAIGDCETTLKCFRALQQMYKDQKETKK